MFRRAAIFAVVLAGIWFLPNVTPSASAEELLDCRDVDCFQRAECNRRIQAALAKLKTSASQIRSFEDPASIAKVIAIELERQDRLRSFLAPECMTFMPAQPGEQPTWLSRLGKRIGEFLTEHLAPSRYTRRDVLRPPVLSRKVVSDKELQGRWDGWITFHDQRSVRVWFQITDSDPDGYVKACSDQGMVMGRVTEQGFLELPRLETLSFNSRLLLWRSPPYYEDLEGYVLLEIEADNELERGLVWVSRALSRVDFPLPTDYLCQDKEVLDRRNKSWTPTPSPIPDP